MADFGRRYLREHNVLGNIVFADMYKQILAGTFTIGLTGNQKYYYIFYNSTFAQNDEIEYEIFAQHGARTLQILTRTGNTSAIITPYLDDVAQDTIDLYTSSDIYNVLKTSALTVVGTKRHSLKIKSTDKNEASGNYIFNLTWLRIK
ncbi:hypothetical protein ES703_34503 [subsurface metagenome]